MSRRQLPACVAVALAIMAPGARAAGLHVIPFPGTPDASPLSQVIFSSLTPGELRSVRVVGSRSGRHSGRTIRLPDHAGVAFDPTEPFLTGERVRVTAWLSSSSAGGVSGDPGATMLKFTFTVARPTGSAAEDVGSSVGPEIGRGRAAPEPRFHSEPGLHPPAVAVSADRDRSSGDMFLTPIGVGHVGAMILDAQGQLVWFHPVRSGMDVNLQVQRYRGRPVLTWFQGFIPGGVDKIMNSSYRVVATVRAGYGYAADLHEFQITPAGTAWIDADVPARADLRRAGGTAHGDVLDDVIQEVDIRTGRVLWEWHALGHVPVTDSHATITDKTADYDYFHLNSIQVLPDGNLLISARNSWAVYEINRLTGRVIWTLGGRHSSFDMARGTRFEWQHDAHLRRDGILTLFDDGASPQEERQSSAKILRIRTATHRATLVRAFHHSPSVLATVSGSVQTLPNGNVFVGWGGGGYFSEYTAAGAQIFDGYLPPFSASYRVFRFHWHGHPATPPKLAVVTKSAGRATVYASWNGATGIRSWRVLGGPTRGSLKPLARSVKTGFETAVDVATPPAYLAVQALGSGAAVLGTSRSVPR